MAEIASVTQRGKFEPFELQVSRGQVAWHRAVVIFGFNSDVDSSPETIWPGGGLLAFPASPIRMKVSSANANDTSDGTGARTVFIGGLDANHNEISETVTLSGQTAVLTTKFYLHINQAYVLTAGNLNGAAGNIYIGDGTVTAGVPATVYDMIAYDYNDRITGSFTIPAGYTGYVMQGLFSTGQSGGSNPVTGRLVTRGTNNIRMTVAVTVLNNGTADYSFEYPVAIPEKTTLEAQGFGASENNSCSSMFILNLIKNDGA